MSLAHIHLLLNHFPIIGTIIGLGLLVLAILMKSDHLKHASLLVLLFIAIIAFPTYLSGNAAEEQIRHLPGVSKELVQAHQDSALLSFMFMEIAGGFAWLGLWRYRRIGCMTRGNTTMVLVLTVITVILMSITGNTGGDIRHPELANDMKMGPGVGLPSAAIGAFVNGSSGIRWAWATCETLHFVGLCVLFGVVFLVNLRMLGMMKSISFATVHRLLPWGVLGFGLNLFTGMLFFVAAPGQYDKNVAFDWKIIFIIIAGLNALYFTLFDETWTLKPGDEAPARAKFVAVSAAFLWIGVMYFGSMLPFIGNAF